MSATRSICSVAAVVLLAATSAACAAQGSDTRTTEADCQSPGVTADKVEVGLIYPDSGNLAIAFNGARAGFDARIGLVNAAGGVNGRQIEYQWRDDKGEPATNLTVSQELVQQENVFAILESSTTASGGAQYLDDNGIPVVGLAVEPQWSEHGNMFAFNYSFTEGESVDTYGNFIRDQGGTRPVIIRDTATGESSNLLAEQFAASIRAAGLEFDEGSIIDFTPGSTSPERLADQLLADGVDTLVGALNVHSFAEVIGAARRVGVPLKVLLTGSAADAELLGQYGASLAGLTFYASYVPFPVASPALDAYRVAVAQYAPQLVDPDQTVTLVSYVSADMLVRGLEAAGPCLTRKSFIDGLRAVKDYNAGGLVSTTDFANYGRINECYAFVRVNAAGNGFEMVNPNYCGTRLQG